MGELPWGVVLVAGYCLLQVPLVLLLARYLEREESLPTTDADTDPGRPLPGTGPGVVGSEWEEAGEEGEVVCVRCQTTNDAGYVFCRECVGRLPAGRAPAAGSREQ